jgi:hypothetical protein
MTTATARKLLNLVNTLEGMMNEVGAKKRLLKTKMQQCKSESDADLIKSATVILGAEIDNINVTIDLVEDLSNHLQQELLVA